MLCASCGLGIECADGSGQTEHDTEFTLFLEDPAAGIYLPKQS